MTTETLVKIALDGGRYEGELTATQDTGIEAIHQGKVIAAARLDRAGEDSPVRVSVDIPPEVLSDGVQVVSLRSTVSGAVLDKVIFLAGDALDDDLRAEIALLRDELELLKGAFRHHVRSQEG